MDMKYILLGVVATTIVGTVGLVSLPLATSGASVSLLKDVILALMPFLVGYIVWLHKRVRSIEQQQNRMWRSLFGEDVDELSEGVIVEVADLIGELQSMQSNLKDISERQKQISAYLDEMNGGINDDD